MRLRKLILILIFILIFIDILRETGVVTCNYYNSSISTNTSDNWSNSITTLNFEKNDSFWQSLRSQLNDRCNFNQSIRNVPAHVSFETENYDDSSITCQKLNIEVTSFRPGMIWTPFFKTTSFSASGSCNETIQILSEDSDKGFRKLYSFQGVFTITGHITVTGLCTYKEAKRLLKKRILEQMLAHGEHQLNKQ